MRQRSAPYKHMESLPPEAGGPGGYDSLLDQLADSLPSSQDVAEFYSCRLAGERIVISLLQTQSTGCVLLLKFRAPVFWSPRDRMTLAGNYASAESYVETQVKLLQK